MADEKNKLVDADKSQRTNESHLRILEHVSPVGIFSMDVQGKCVFVNDRWCEITGLSSDGAMGDGWISAIHPEEVTLVKNAWNFFVKKEIPFKKEFRFQQASGREVWVVAQAIADRDDQGNILGYIGAITDVSEFKEVERQAQIKESAINSSLNAIAMAGLDGRLNYVNDAFLKLWGLPKSKDALGRHALEFWDEPDKAGDVLQNLLQTGFVEAELVGKKSDESIFIVKLIANLVKDNQGNTVCLMASFVDITRQKQAEKQLIQERNFTSAVLESAGALIVVLDGEGRFETFNAECERVTGYKSEEVLGRFIWDIFIDKEELDSVKAVFKEVHDFGISSTYENAWLTKKGEKRIISWSNTAITGDDGSGSHIVSVGIDSTEKRQAENELSKSRAQFESMFNSIPDAVIYVDVNRHVLMVNPAVKKLFGYDQYEMLGGTTEIIYARKEDYIFQGKKRFSASAAVDVLPYEILYKRKGGAEFWGETLGTTVRDTGGNILGFIGIIRDISERRFAQNELQQYRVNLEELVNERTRELEETILRVEMENAERRKAEASLLKAKEDAELANRLKSDFLGRMSHELRTPMNAILGFGQLLESENLSDEQESFVDEILRAGKHLLVLIDEVLNLSQIESGGIDVKLDDVLLDDVIRDAVALVWQQANEKGIEVNNNSGDEKVFVRADYERLKEVLVNLLTNAIKYNKHNGQVDIGLTKVSANRTRIWVRDTGTGIPMEKLALVFEPFNRLGAEFSTVQGTGIGLSIARKLVEKMGGEIGLDSQVGSGTTFWVELDSIYHPADLGEIEKILVPVDESGAPSIRPYCILYIEDDRANMRLVRHIVERIQGISLLEAEEGVAGLVLAKQFHPDLIIVDINLPGMDGYEILAELKKMPETLSIPVMALSAAAMPADVERGLLAGFMRYMTKPIEVKTMHKAIEDFRLAGMP